MRKARWTSGPYTNIWKGWYIINVSASTSDVVAGYIRRGLAPIPIPPRSKNRNREKWQEERWTVEDVRRLFNNGQNVGILCGSTSSGGVDVDCDCPEAVRLAPKFLVPTLKGGRDTVPGSHWWYTAPGCRSVSLKDVHGKTILELRADGRQSVVYPSVHPEGDTYRWYTDSSEKMEPVEAEDLEHGVRLLYIAAMIARHMPPIGARHDYALALAGFLLRHERFGEDDAQHVMVAAWSLFEDATREALKDVENAVKTTAERLEKKLPVRGGGALAVFDERLTKTLADGCGWRLGGEEDTAYAWGVPEDLPEDLPPVPEFDYRMLPDAFRGWVEDVAERMQVPPDFVATPLMVAFSAVVGRKVGVRPKTYDDWLVVANLWGAIVGSPGLLKSPALKEALAPMNALIARAIEDCKEEVKEYEAEREIFEARQDWFTSEKRKLARAGDLVKLQDLYRGEPPRGRTRTPQRAPLPHGGHDHGEARGAPKREPQRPYDLPRRTRRLLAQPR